MGKTAEVAGHGGPATGDGGAGDARALRRRRRAARPAAQHTAARRRVRAGRASTATSPLPASRADEKQLPAAAEQVRERRAGVGGRRGVPAARRGRQEGRAAAEGDALVGAHGRARGGVRAGRVRRRGLPAVRLRGLRGLPAVRDGAAPRRARAAARRVTRAAPSAPAAISRLHSIIGTVGRAAPRSIIDLLFIYSGAAARFEFRDN